MKAATSGEGSPGCNGMGLSYDFCLLGSKAAVMLLAYGLQLNFTTREWAKALYIYIYGQNIWTEFYLDEECCIP